MLGAKTAATAMKRATQSIDRKQTFDVLQRIAYCKIKGVCACAVKARLYGANLLTLAISKLAGYIAAIDYQMSPVS